MSTRSPPSNTMVSLMSGLTRRSPPDTGGSPARCMTAATCGSRTRSSPWTRGALRSRTLMIKEEWPYPDESAQGTGPLGLYGVFDIAPGPVAVAAGGKDKSGEMVGLGFQRVRVFPVLLPPSRSAG